MQYHVSDASQIAMDRSALGMSYRKSVSMVDMAGTVRREETATALLEVQMAGWASLHAMRKQRNRCIEGAPEMSYRER